MKVFIGTSGRMLFELRSSRHRRGQELCAFYVRHFHIWRWTLWTR